MTMNLLTQNGLTIGEAINRILNNAVARLRNDSNRIMSQGLLWTTKNHLTARFPGSTHYSPDNVSTNNDGSIDVDIAGATRAYHDITIRPVHSKALTIPIHARAYGKKVADFNGQLFKPKGKNVLMMNIGSKAVAMFVLAKKAFQKQDETLLPKDETYAKNIDARLFKAFDAILAKEIKNI